jgi:hypothetical protein
MTENGVAQVPPDEDRTPTQEDAPPVTPPAEAWVMPEPVFRKSDGYTPNAPRPDPVENTAATAERDMPANEDAAANPAAPIAEQPDLADVVTDPAVNVVSFQRPKKKGGFLRVLLLIIGIGAMVLVAAAVVTTIVFWYFFQVSDSQNLN